MCAQRGCFYSTLGLQLWSMSFHLSNKDMTVIPDPSSHFQLLINLFMCFTADSETVAREEEAIKLDGLSVAQMKELKDKSEKHVFQAEVNRMMKLIINSLYKNKEVCLKPM